MKIPTPQEAITATPEDEKYATDQEDRVKALLLARTSRKVPIPFEGASFVALELIKAAGRASGWHVYDGPDPAKGEPPTLLFVSP